MDNLVQEPRFQSREDYVLLDLVQPTRFPLSLSILPFQQSRAAVKWTVVWAEITTRSESDRESKDNLSGIRLVDLFRILFGT